MTTIDRVADEVFDLLSADATMAKDDDDENWLAPWYLQKEAEYDAAQKAITEHAALLLKQLGSKRVALQRYWGASFENQVRQDLEAQGGKKKSVTYATGTAGYRKTGGKDKLTIDDATAAMGWAKEQCPEAVKTVESLLKSELLKHTKDTGEVIPGTRLETTPVVDKFFPPRDQALLGADDE